MKKYTEYTKDLQRILNKVKMFMPYSEIRREYLNLESKIMFEYGINPKSHSLWFRCFPTDTSVNDLNDLDIMSMTKENRNYMLEKIDMALNETELAIYVS